MNEPTGGITTGLKKIYGQDYNPLNRGVNNRHCKAINILSRLFVREVMARDILPIPEKMPFKKILETVSCFRHLYYPVVNNR